MSRGCWDFIFHHRACSVISSMLVALQVTHTMTHSRKGNPFHSLTPDFTKLGLNCLFVTHLLQEASAMPVGLFTYIWITLFSNTKEKHLFFLQTLALPVAFTPSHRMGRCVGTQCRRQVGYVWHLILQQAAGRSLLWSSRGKVFPGPVRSLSDEYVFPVLGHHSCVGRRAVQ